MGQKIEGVFRHILTLVAGFLIAFNVLPEDAVNEGVELIMTLLGAVLAVIAFIRSWITKDDEESAAKVALLISKYLEKNKK